MTGLPVVDDTALPREVREGTSEQRQAYAASLGFERMLVETLARTMVRTTGDDADESTAATAAYRDMLPATLADAVTANGGLGVALDVYRAIA